MYWTAISTHKKFIVYFVTGVSAAVLDVCVYFVLYTVFGFQAFLATSISIGLSTFYAFAINAFVNFKTSDRLLRRFSTYALVSGAGLIFSVVTLFVLVDLLGLHAVFMKLLTLPFIFVMQYILNTRYSFNDLASKVTPRTKPTLSSEKRVAVVGGGFCGLVAAYRLAQNGVQVTLFERSNVVGGLAAGSTIGGLPLERAYHFLYKTDNYILDLAEELGVRDNIQFYPSSVGFFYNGLLYPFTTALHLLVFKPLSVLDRIRTGVVGFILQTVTDWEPLQRYTAHEWLRAFCGDRVTSIMWEPLLRGKFDRYYDKVTMSWLWGRINIRAKSRSITGDEQLGYVTGGFRTITKRLEQEICARGGEIRTNTTLTNVLRNEDGSMHITTETDQATYDAVLFTTPSHVATNLLKENESLTTAYVEKAQAVEYLDAIVMPFVTNQKLGSYFWYNITDKRIPFLALLSTSALTGSELFGGKHVYYIGAYVPREHRYMTMNTDDIRNEWYEGLRCMFPEFDRDAVIEDALYRMKDAQHVVGKGFCEQKLLPYTTPVPGAFLTNFTQIYPDDRGTNFAVREGTTAAQLVLDHLSQTDHV